MGIFKKNRTKNIEDVMGVKVLSDNSLDTFLAECADIYRGFPYWIGDKVNTVNFASTIAGEIARLATMNTEISVDGSARAEWLRGVMDDCASEWRNWVELGCAIGTMILKPNEDGIDVLTPERFFVLGAQNGDITDIVFRDCVYNAERNIYFTRLERHTLTDVYTITNRVYAGYAMYDLDHEVSIEVSPWNGINDEVVAEGVERMLFGVFRFPGANNIDHRSPLGLPCFSHAVEELKDLDIAYSLNAKEIAQSAKVVMLDSDRLTPNGRLGVKQRADVVANAGLPDYIKLVDGDGINDVYQEINPSLHTTERVVGINNLLSQIGFKCGFSNGYFVFNEKTGMVTATQVESDDRRTLQMINDVRTQFKELVEGLVYALDRFADAYGWSAYGTYTIAFDFADLTINPDEDRARWMTFVLQGLIPFWRYLVRFEGMTEDEAKEMAQTEDELRLFPEAE